jgi:hypothetical protein
MTSLAAAETSIILLSSLILSFKLEIVLLSPKIHCINLNFQGMNHSCLDGVLHPFSLSGSLYHLLKTGVPFRSHSRCDFGSQSSQECIG